MSEFVIINFEEFSLHCDKSRCLKGSFISRNCRQRYKQERCYKKYVQKIERNFEDTNKYDERIQFRKKILDRDKTCRIWNILNQEERKFILDNFYDDYILLGSQLDVCHIIPRSQAPEKLYDEDNVFLASRYFHSLLDTLVHPVDKTRITNSQRLEWCLKAFKGD